MLQLTVRRVVVMSVSISHSSSRLSLHQMQLVHLMTAVVHR